MTTTAEREVRALAHEYEAALAVGDAVAARALFAADERVSRLGPEGLQVGPGQVGAVRTTRPLGEAAWLHESCRAVAPDVVLHVAVLDRADHVVQRTQVWHRGPEGWRIAHAHVSHGGRP